MIVGKLTWAIVILMELHGEAYQFTAGEERKSETLGGQMLRQKEVNYPTQFDSVFFFRHHRVCVCVFRFNNGGGSPRLRIGSRLSFQAKISQRIQSH